MPVISGKTEELSVSVKSLKEKKGEDLHFSKSLPFTDTSMKMELLSVNHHHNGQKFTDKPSKTAALSVNLDLIKEANRTFPQSLK